MTPATETEGVVCVDVVADENRRLRLALESIRDTAEMMTRSAKTPTQTHALAHLRALADDALEAA